MISVSNLGKSYGDRVLFQDASFQLNPGERYGLIGANGSGKTTLLGILADEVEATDGTVAIPKRLRTGVLLQDQFLYDEESVLSVALMGNMELYEAMREKEALLAATADGAEFDGDRFNELEETVQRLDGYAAEAEAATILEGLGIPTEVHHDPVRTLSGGFKLRVLLAQVLAGRPDVLLLDEPTNHLDILSIRWLENFLAQFPGPAVIISHDHRFLDNVVTHILDVDYQTVTLYPGDYSEFLRLKAAERERREKEIAGREREIADLQRFVDRFRAKASKARQAQSKVKQIERRASEIEELPPSSRRWPTFRFEPRRSSGKQVLTAEGICKAFGDNQVLTGVDLTVTRGDRLAIMGPNGIGKSTLLKILIGRLEADEGEVTWGYETHPGYFAQDHADQFDDPTQSAEDWLWEVCPDKDLGFVRGRLGLMLFSGEDGRKPVETLSGGEAARLAFARIGIERPNVLVLDEPTNHLDLESIEALVEALQEFEGTLVFVSHDRWFVGELATRIVDIRADGVRDFEGTYEDYVHWCGDDHLDADQVVLKAKREQKADRAKAKRESTETGEGHPTGDSAGEEAAGRPAASGLSSNPMVLKRKRDELTARIDAAETRVAEIDALFCRPGYYEETSPAEVQRLESERDRLSEELETLLARWEEVEDRLAAVTG